MAVRDVCKDVSGDVSGIGKNPKRQMRGETTRLTDIPTSLIAREHLKPRLIPHATD